MIHEGAVERSFVVGVHDTAVAVGSGSTSVLATPRLVAWCEAATCVLIDPELGPGETTVGTRVHVDHMAATPVGGRVTVRAAITRREGRAITFEVAATDDAGTIVMQGIIRRVVVDAARFVARLG